jgi:hypothetical protein
VRSGEETGIWHYSGAGDQFLAHRFTPSETSATAEQKSAKNSKNISPSTSQILRFSKHTRALFPGFFRQLLHAMQQREHVFFRVAL